MRCTHCGTEIPEGRIYCPKCGAEVQIVPDYNPLDDVLTQEVRGSVRDATRPIKTDDIRNRSYYGRDAGYKKGADYGRRAGYERGDDRRGGASYREDGSRRGDPSYRGDPTYRGDGGYRRDTDNRQQAQNRAANSTRVMSEAELDEIRERRARTARKRSASLEEEQRRRKAERKRMLMRRRRRMMLGMTAGILVVIGVLAYILYQNSYAGQVKKGYAALQTKEYAVAEKYFNRAAAKDGKRAGAYEGLAQMYMDQDNQDEAESVYLSAIASYPSSVELYESAIAFYEETDQLGRISAMLDDCEDENVLEAVSSYVSVSPQFSLEEGKYEEVQEVSLTADGGTIYYTTDGTDPTSSSTEYTEPIQLDQEGKTEIRAVSYNEKGIPSTIVSGKYTIEFPIADAPVVTPSTGQYDVPTQITITVPEGYEAFYTTDGTEPTENSKKYTGPIDMPQGQTIFSAVLRSKNGKLTQITKRNYVYQP